MFPLQIPGESVLGLAVVGVVFLTVLAFFGAIIYTEHRKEMKLIETGQYHEPRESRAWVLAAGLLLLALGLADLLRAVWVGAVPGDGLTLALLGVAALVYFAYRQREDRRTAATRDGETRSDGETER